MARIERASIEQVLAAADMLEIVGRYTQLRKAGANYSGLCPFHEEKTPSFSVNPVEKLYYCFGCGEGGDLLGFVQKKEGLDFTAAVEALAERYGIELRYEEGGPDDAVRRRKDRLRRLLEQSCSYYERVLREARAAEAARAYLQRRALGEQVCGEYRLGYSFTGWRRLHDAALARGFTERELLDAGLVVRGGRGSVYDRFRGRLMFPLTDERGRVLGFGARTLTDETPKYLNSPETQLYQKGKLLFGLDKAREPARREDRVFVVEGYTDVLALVQAGIHNVVASMGTALTEEQLASLQRYTTNIFLCFDADAAGLAAMDRALRLSRDLGVALRVVRVPEGLDPADYIQSGRSADDFRALAERAQTLLQFRVRTVLSAHDLAKPEERTRALTLLRDVLAQAASPLERDEEVRYVADSLRLSPESVRHLLSGLSVAGGRGAGGSAGSAVPIRLLALEHDLEARFLAACLALPERGSEVLATVDESYFVSTAGRNGLEAVRVRLEPQRAGKKGQETHAAAAPGEGIVAEIVVRSSGEQFTERVLEELYLRLQEAHVSRLIRRLRSRLTVSAPADDNGQEEARLLELEGIRRRLRDAIRLIPVEE